MNYIIDKELYNFNWQKLIDSLLEIDYKKRIDINQVNILLEEFNENNFVKPINEINYLNDGEKSENIIKGEIYINKYDKNLIPIINSFENVKRNELRNNAHSIDYFKYDYSQYENEKEIKNNIQIKIDGKFIGFDYYYTFDEEGKHNIEYSFKHNLTKANHIFYGCKLLTSLDLSNFNSQNVTNMSEMFRDCKSLKNLNLSNLNNQNVTNMSYMFCGCKSLISLNLSDFNTQNLSDMRFMFAFCDSLTNINLSNFNIQNVVYMTGSFFECKSLTYLNLSNFNTQNVRDISYMFSGCKSLTNLNLLNFNTQNVMDSERMFDYCESLKEPNIIIKDKDNVVLYEYSMFIIE